MSINFKDFKILLKDVFLKLNALAPWSWESAHQYVTNFINPPNLNLREPTIIPPHILYHTVASSYLVISLTSKVNMYCSVHKLSYKPCVGTTAILNWTPHSVLVNSQSLLKKDVTKGWNIMQFVNSCYVFYISPLLLRCALLAFTI